MPEAEEPRWLVEDGVGEIRALLVQHGEVLAAKLRWPGEITAGEQYAAQLASKRGGTRRGVALLDSGIEVLVDHLPVHATEGARGTVRITRAPIAERGRFKRAQGRWVDGDDKRSPPATVFDMGKPTRSFEAGLWEEIWHAASSGTLEFPGGAIVCSVTPAMTVIDIDGDAVPRDLALSAIPAIARALHWFDLGGSIGIDFPTLEAKTDRRLVDSALDQALADWPHERTAMNGFGFVQLVARLEGPSLLHRFAASRVGMCACMALRVAERVDGAGITQLTVHPALKAKLKPEWLDELRRRTGRDLRIETDPTLALEAPHAQVVSA